MNLYVTGYFRSGGHWLASLLMRALHAGMRSIMFSELVPSNGLTVVQCHKLPGDIGTEHVVHIVRDPRDVAVSMLHFWPDHESVDKVFETMRSISLGYVAPWNETVRAWHDAGVPQVTYEGLSADTVGVLAQTLSALGFDCPIEDISAAVEACTFERMRGQFRGYRPGYFWRGVVGEWRDRFALEDEVKAEQYFGETARLVGVW